MKGSSRGGGGARAARVLRWEGGEERRDPGWRRSMAQAYSFALPPDGPINRLIDRSSSGGSSIGTRRREH